MSIRFGDHSTDTGVTLENGMYDATIRSVELVMENGQPKVNTNGKKQVDVTFEIDPETTVRRRYPVGFGQNSANGQWAGFAKLLEVATGTKCGDPAQRNLTDQDLVRRRVRVVIEMNDRGYSDVSNVMAAPANGNGASRQRPQPVGAAPATDAGPGAATHDEIPFGW